MLHDKPCVQFCLFDYLPFAMPFCLMHTDCLVKLAHRTNAFTSGVAPCIILATNKSIKFILLGDDNSQVMSVATVE